MGQRNQERRTFEENANPVGAMLEGFGRSRSMREPTSGEGWRGEMFGAGASPSMDSESERGGPRSLQLGLNAHQHGKTVNLSEVGQQSKSLTAEPGGSGSLIPSESLKANPDTD